MAFAQDIRGLAKLWPWLRPERRLIIVGVVLIPLIAGMQVLLPLILKHTIDSGIGGNDSKVLLLGGVAFLAAVLLEYGFRATQALATSTAIHRMIRALRRHLIGHVLRLSPSYHDRNLSGALVTRATGDFDNLTESLNLGVLTAVIDCAVLVGIVIGMFTLDFRLALLACAALPVVGWIISWFSSALKGAMLKARAKIAALNAYTQECLYGASTVKVLTAEREASTRFRSLNYAYRDAQMHSVILDALMFAVLDGIASITVGFIFWILIRGWVDQAGITVGVLIAFAQYMQQLFEPLKQLGNKMAMLQGAFTSIDRIFGILGEKPEITGSAPPPQLRGDVMFEHVTFCYRKDQSRPILDDVSFQLHAGESIALVGATGSGKSTIIKLLTRLYAGYTGNIKIDGIDLNTLDPQLLRRQIAIVPQDIALFDGTIAFNICLGIEGITQEQIKAAAELVHAADFIRDLPGQYEYMVKEQGANLSHGQRQLIAFARALARQPQLVILDEATSAVDPVSEQRIQSAIEKMLVGHSTIVIAHRLSTIERCSKIIVMEKGRILETGTHDELMAKRSAYWHLREQPTPNSPSI